MSTIEVIAQTTRLSKSFSQQVAVKNVDLTISQGSVHVLCGANGAGKSTLLRLLMGVMWPDAGEVRIFGQPLSHESAPVRQRVHYVGADGEMFPSFQVRDVCKLAALLFERYDNERMQTLLQQLELPLRARIGQLSTGTKMQLRLAIALAVRPDLLILDEPTGGLDPVVKQYIYQVLVDQVSAGGTTVLMATHQIADVERIADTVSVMVEGRLATTQSLEALQARYRRLQVITQTPLTDHIVHHEGVLAHDCVGKVATLLIDASRFDAPAIFEQIGYDELTSMDVSLEESVRAVLQGEGYTRKGTLS